MNDNIQLIVCVECSKASNSDYIYIKKFIDHYFILGNNKISPVYLSSKNNYKSKSTINKIKALENKFTGKSKVIYFLDSDDTVLNHDNQSMYNEVKEFIKNNVYDVVWFVEDVESVFLGKQVKSNKKVEAEKFMRTNGVNSLNKNNLLTYKLNSKGTSNIFTVISKHLEQRKRSSL